MIVYNLENKSQLCDLFNNWGLAKMNLLPKLSLRSVQPGVAKRHLVNALFAKAWAVAFPQGDNMVMR